jgi:hypothetical protein
MKSAIEIVAFSQGSDIIGILNLLEVTREALDRSGYTLAAAHLDMATIAISEQTNDNALATLNNSLRH